MENESAKDIIDKIEPIFNNLKKIIDNYPKAFFLEFDISLGYVISIDLNLLKHPLSTEDDNHQPNDVNP